MLQQWISSAEFGDWLAFYERRPFGPRLRDPGAAAPARAADPQDVYQQLKTALQITAAAQVTHGR